jgi:5'-3' exoribonuclease 2
MGVPKFFRWISERYPKINQPIHAPPNPETQQVYFPNESIPSIYKENDAKSKQDNKVYMQKNSIIPEFDRLYLDMNGIIHCASHNNAGDDNATVDPDTHLETDKSPSDLASKPLSEVMDGTVHISEDDIFRNVCYYVDRVVTDIVKPKELVYMAIDGVAPRAKMNQQRSRRYRSGKEREIEKTFYAASMLKQKKETELRMGLQQSSREKNEDFNGFDDYEDFNFVNMDGEYEYNRDNVNKSMKKKTKDDTDFQFATETMNASDLKEVEPGRFTGKFETSGKASPIDGNKKQHMKATSGGKDDSSSPFEEDYDEFVKSLQKGQSDEHLDFRPFHSNEITPGTPFFERCTAHLHHFIKRKLHTDPRWAHLNIIFSGPRTPGEGEVSLIDYVISV